MAITSVALTQEGVKLSGNAVSTSNILRTYDATYRVKTDAATTNPKVVEEYFRTGNDDNGKRLPYYGRAWQWNDGTGGGDASAVCNRFRVVHQPKSAGIFIVEVGFDPEQVENQTRQGQDGRQTDKPDKWIETYSKSYTQISEVAEKAVFEGFNPPGINNPFLQVGVEHIPCNSALTPYNPPLEELVNITVHRFGTYVADLNDTDDWNDYINDQDFFVHKPFYRINFKVPKWRGWLKHVGGNLEFINNEVWYRRDAELWVHPRSWVKEYADKGTEERIAPGDRKPGPNGNETWSNTDFDVGDPMQQEIVGQNGKPIRAPVKLDGNGKPLQGDRLKETVYLKWRTQRQKNLGLFGW
jgi:hypothetical protein